MPNGLFRQNMPEKGLKQKSKHHHRILDIRNSISTKFQLILTILNFWTKLTQKGYLQPKKVKQKTKITIEFYIFELV